MKLLDGRSLEGGLLPAQDHRARLEVDSLLSLVCVRVVSVDPAPLVHYREDESVHGHFRGLFPWRPTTGATGIGSIDSITTDARPLGCARWQAGFPVITVGEVEPGASDPGKSPDDPGKGPSIGEPVARYFPVGVEPEFFTENGVTFALVSHTPQSTYTTPGGLVMGSFLYAPSSPGSGGGTGPGKSLGPFKGDPTKGPAPPPKPPFVYIVIRSDLNAFFVVIPPTPPAPEGYVYTGNMKVDQVNVNETLRRVQYIFTFEYALIQSSNGGGGGGGNNTERGTGDPDKPGSAGEGPGLVLLPTRETKYVPDPRFNVLVLDDENRRPFLAKNPTGTYGIVMQTMDEDRQVEQFHHTDPRLVAVNFAGGEACGTLVCDLNDKSGYEHQRMARLHSMMRVIRKPRVTLGGSNANFEGNGNALALQFGVSGRLDAPGGFAIDNDILAKWSRRYGGCMDTGSGGDKHQIGVDADFTPINAMHLNTLSLFRANTTHDGPLDFNAIRDKPFRDDGPFAHHVYMWFDPVKQYQFNGKTLSGVWRWYGTDLMQVVTPREPTVPVSPPIPIAPPPTPPGRGPDPIDQISFLDRRPETGVSATVQRGASQSFGRDSHRRHVEMMHEFAPGGLLARPLRYLRGVPDTRYQEGIDAGGPDAIEEALRSSPIVARISSWGAQGGRVGGPYLDKDTGGTQIATDSFRYTQTPGDSRHRGGTGSGGFLVLPPEVDLSDIDDDFAPAGLTLSETYFAVGPGARFGAGIPELASGWLRDGVSWGIDGGVLGFSAHDGNGAMSDIFTVEDGLIDLDAGTALMRGGDTFLTDADPVPSHGTNHLPGGSDQVFGPSPDYTITNDLTSRTFDADTVTLAQLADVVATLLRDMDGDTFPRVA